MVEAVAQEAAAEIDNVALRAELARQVELISESRSRLATAHLEERRRIERDLHDGAQQRLLAIALQLQSAQVNGATTVLRDEVDRAIAELGITVQELRDLAGGLQPAALAGGGLLAAVVDLASRIPLNITYDVVDQRFPPERRGRGLVRHRRGDDQRGQARRRRRRVDHGHESSSRRCASSSRTTASATPTRGAEGCRGWRTGSSALGGRLRVTENQPHGTVVEAELPCVS